MSPSLPADARRPALTRLLRDLGPRIRRGSHATSAEAQAPLATGIAALDRALGGGLAPGRVGELSGPVGSGRTSLALAWLAQATGAGRVVAVVDAADAFHPASAAAAGVRLERVLWARPPDPRAATRCCERLLQARGFAAVLLDTAGADARRWAAQPTATWQRLARAAAAADSALIVLSPRRLCATAADLALELRPAAARFCGTPSLFEGLEVDVAITRRRRTPDAPDAVRLHFATGRSPSASEGKEAGECRPTRSEPMASEGRSPSASA